MKIMLAPLVVFILIISCGDKPKEGPSEIYYGEDICERCKMIISEKDFAAQYELSNGKSVKFDDLGCLFHYMEEENESISSIYVVDYNSKEWIEGAGAYYVWTDNIITPMGYGIVAFKDNQKAKDLANKEKGKYLGGLKDATVQFLIDNKNNQE